MLPLIVQISKIFLKKDKHHCPFIVRKKKTIMCVDYLTEVDK